MKNSYKLGLASIVASIALVGCGGGSTTPETVTPETVSGKFIDAAVAGLNYACSSGKTDITDSEGQYTCNVGDKVSFSLGGYSLGGEVDASSGMVTPDTLWPNDAAAALNVAQLLQTVTTTDANGNLVVPENFTDLDDSTVEITAADFDTAIVADLTDITALVSEADAQAHLDKSATLVFLAGKTFYNADAQGIESLVFNADGTGVTITNLADGTSETISISIDGDTITPANGYTPLTVLDIFEGQIILEGADGLENWILDQSERAKTLLANNTWVATGFTVTFNADVTSLTINGVETETASLDGMFLTHAGETDLINVVSDTEIQLFDTNVGDWTVFYLEGTQSSIGVSTTPVTAPTTSWYTTSISDPTAAAALESFVSGNILVFDTVAGQATSTFAADGSYTEINPDGTCSGKWAVIGDNEIGTTCSNPASTVMPTSTGGFDMFITFYNTNVGQMGSITFNSPDGAADGQITSVTPL